MRRWFELGELADGTYAASSGDRLFLQLPQKAEFIAWANQGVGVITRLTTGPNSDLCEGVGSPHPIQHVAGVNLLSWGGEFRSEVLFNGIPPSFLGLCRSYGEKPGINDGPNETQTVEPQRRSSSQAGKGPAGKITLSTALYLTLLWQTYLIEGKFAAANTVLNALGKYQAGLLTDAQVLAIVSKLPKTQ